ncbi:MAG: FtsQ-type POTRA domain-containing protein [Candidatus Marinimicrobia bacterium]|jgi:cell division septal protein FtsQ|nr:FtsQ-type POTRA domain-containing protein [Candidatus Neomarinimicrobiota bacterium]MBT3617202.1 FtsQ-type POTRA domain-containing protein [Candidatus Neomarinimicrobiota bacterium]MBT3829761.1 FtsQ-type POTRA domain-containing protein [Candidatus Neomarinimicrobiota bacterium]MBT3997892.1 FtsQ-type POTRA domain-containing protein [Candidatus Neomarinimicrobiota bacterium]MBT4281270.1 FtsQ-type POTRA domain-containing protein [Candidatus Neomarinimicrobiota bacterium]
MKNNRQLMVKLALFAGLLGFVGFAWAAIAWSSETELFRIEQIQINGKTVIDKDDYIEILGDWEGLSTREIHQSDIRLAFESHPFVEAVRVSKQYPKTIRIDLVERNPVAFINMKPLVMVDRLGVILPAKGISDHYDIPYFSGFNPDKALYPPGFETRSQKMQEAVGILSRIKREYVSLYNNISEVTLSGNDEYIFILAERPTRIILGKNNPWQKLEVLREFESALEQPHGITLFKQIDLRHQNQVVTRTWS